MQSLKSSEIQSLAGRWNTTDISEEHTASIFRVEEEAKQETSVKAGGKQSDPAAYSSVLKIETFSSETSVDFQRTTRLYIPED
jgi:hypothetical protein